jgi:hypothetical protein
MDNYEFIPLKEIIISYRTYSLEKKLNILRKLSRDITFNEDYQFQIVNDGLIPIIINDINNILILNKEINENNLTYVRIFCMFLHNELGSDSSLQKIIFEQAFKINNNFEILQNIINKYIKDLKVQKFLMGIIYKEFILNTNILTNELKKEHIEFFLNLINQINYNELIHKNNNIDKKDKDDINDWIHIIFTYILKNGEEIKNINEGKNTLLNIILNTNNIIYFEIIRDIIEYLKQSKILLISSKNIKYLSELFTQTIEQLNNYISENIHNLNQNYELVSSNDSFIFINKKIICGVDIMSVLLTTEDLNNTEYRKIIFKNIEARKIIIKIINILKNTDELYDKVFTRSKGEKENEKKLNKHLENSNMFYGLQTNLLKFISNFCYNNENAKNYFINEPKDFYYMLNHLKMDKCNPLKYEYAVLMIKALCEDCKKIQDLIKELKPVEMDPLLKDYIINKGKQKVTFANNEKDLYFSMLNKKI